jgi:hypothetical protein
MADSRETYAFPEMTLYVWTGTGSALVAYAQDVELQISRSIKKFLFPTTAVGYASRSQFVETDKNVSLSIGTFYAGASLYGMLASGANISATINLSAPADGASSVFTVWSAQMPDFDLQGSEGNIWKQKVKLISPDCSGL